MRVLYALSCSGTVRAEAEYAVTSCLSSLGFFYSPFEPDLPGTLLCYGEITEEMREKVVKGEWAVRILHDPAGFEGMVNERKSPKTEAPTADESGLLLLFPVSGGDSPTPPGEIVGLDGSRLTGVSETRMGAGGVITVHFDLLAGVFFFLSRVEEAFSSERDRFGRFPQERIFCVRKGFEAEPLANSYLLLLEELLFRAARMSGHLLLRKMEWPAAQPYCVSLTHDVDRVAKWRGRAILKGILAGKGREVLFSIQRINSDPYWNFDLITGLEGERGVGSSFYFFAFREKNPGGRYDCEYVRALLRQLSADGYEIGLHGSYESMEDGGRLIAEKSRLANAAGDRISGIRQHYLRLKVPETIRSMEEAGFDYDASVGFSDRVGFRASMCLPYHLYDFDNSRPFGILEVPISVMDTPLLTRGEEAREDLRHMAERVRASRGVLSVIWHQRSFDDDDFPGMGRLYEWFLDLVSADRPFFASHKELCTWWRLRKGVSIASAETSGKRTALCIESKHEIPMLSFELCGRVGSVSCEGAAIRVSSRGGEERRVFTLTEMRKPGFRLILERKGEG
ncbi:MAG: polysaccharide deacetylase family protein [bacterium]